MANSFAEAIRGNNTKNSPTPVVKTLPAPTVKTTHELKLGLSFNDGDTRLITVPNPKTEITTDTFTTALTNMTGVFIGDKASGQLSRFYTAYREDVTKVSQVIHSET